MTTEKQIDFPPLPTPFDVAYHNARDPAFSAQQMRDYVAADRAQRQAEPEIAAYAEARVQADRTARAAEQGPCGWMQNIDTAMKEPLFQALRGIMGTENTGQDTALLQAIRHYRAKTPPEAQRQAVPVALLDQVANSVLLGNAAPKRVMNEAFRDAAVNTLESLGYEWIGSAYWRPPIGLSAAPQPAQVQKGYTLVPVEFLRGFNTLAHNYGLKAIAPSFYYGVERDAFSAAYARCGSDLADLRAMLAAVPDCPR